MILDMHCDTLYRIHSLRRQAGNAGESNLRDGEKLCVNLRKMQKGDYLLQNFAVYLNLEKTEAPFAEAMEMVHLFEQELEQNRDLVRQARNVSEIRRNRAEGYLSAMLTLEEGGMCENRIENLREFYAHGARMMTLGWNYENGLSCPAADGADAGGLKETGFFFVEEMQRLGMLVDVSHLSDRGFYDVCQTLRTPFVASHSNARALCGHSRNLTDDMLRQLGEHGGVAGLNYYPVFLADEPGAEDALTLLARHACHMIDVGGEGCVALGSDFDGFEGGSTPKDAEAVSQLVWAFHRVGLPQRVIDGILWENALRVYGDVLG